MNVIQSHLGVSEKVQGSKANVNFGKQQIVEMPRSVENSDRVSKTAANDEIVAKVLSYTLGQTIAAENKVEKSQSRYVSSSSDKIKQSEAQQSKIDSVSSDKNQFSVDKVAENVINFVTNALTKFIQNGHDESEIAYFKEQAIEGVNHGIEEAKKELTGLVTDDVLAVVDTTKDKMIAGIQAFDIKNEIQNNLLMRNKGEEGNSVVNIQSSTNQTIKISFDSQAIAHDKLDGESFSITTSSTNSLLSINSEDGFQKVSELADLINKTDDVLNTFYRKDIQTLYENATELGYSTEELKSQAKLYDNNKVVKQFEKYDQIKHFVEKNESHKIESPKAVADYINKYLNVLQSSNDLLASKEDFNQIINGIVNQMKDVQVPDLLHAINKFHSFNKKLDL